ncbi:heme ABC exporter ATP-binding protein CcmA [Microvirga sp. 2TAF3]|uniref:heme ABC exporter ATP-binding protein CcmA n=1 Tax=Microvirga sp. 2TAF3 TaxID=3233014 RepID=UPI003F99656F
MRLIVENLACVRGERTLFHDLSFTLERGSGLILTGRNGVGKTSLLRILAGLLQPAAGRIVQEGGDPERDRAEQVHFVGIKDALKPSMTVLEHVRHWYQLFQSPWFLDVDRDGPLGRNYRERILLLEMGLEEQAHLPVAYLSAGQRRRLALTRLYTSHRKIWLLDEPLNALDAISRENIRGRLTHFMAQGGILVLATHEPIKLSHTRILELRRDMTDVEPQSGFMQ